jgi:hypothetical protein
LIYFIQEDREDNDGMVKIGFAEDDIHRRIGIMQTGNPYYLRLLGVIPNGTKKHESKLHRRFKNARIWIRARGRVRWSFRGEWLRPVPVLLEYIRSLPEWPSKGTPLRAVPIKPVQPGNA